MIDWQTIEACQRPTSATREYYQVRASELCLNGRQSVCSLAEYLQETAIRNSNLLNLGMDSITQCDLAWVVARMALYVRHYPHQGDNVCVETWYGGTDGRFGKRIFRLYDDNNLLIACALSRFALFDLKARTIADWPDFITERLPRAGEDPLRFSPPKLAAPETPDSLKSLSPRLGDIDFFNHVNNTRLIEWTASALADTVKNPFQPKSLDVVFKQECRLEDHVNSAAKTEGGLSRVSLSTDTGAEILRAQLSY